MANEADLPWKIAKLLEEMLRAAPTPAVRYWAAGWVCKICDQMRERPEQPTQHQARMH
jgi:hypothetical protein